MHSQLRMMATILAATSALAFGCGRRSCGPHVADHGHFDEDRDGPCDSCDRRRDGPCEHCEHGRGDRGGHHGDHGGRGGHPDPHQPPPPVAAHDPVPMLGPPPRHLGEVMGEIGRRLERAGRAVEAGNWEFAAYDVHELDEVFEDEVALIVTPDDVPLDVGKVAAGFARAQLPVLEDAIEHRDRAAFERAFAQTADGCNSCHRAANHGFVVIPTRIGESIPQLTVPTTATVSTPATPTPPPPPRQVPRQRP